MSRCQIIVQESFRVTTFELVTELLRSPLGKECYTNKKKTIPLTLNDLQNSTKAISYYINYLNSYFTYDHKANKKNNCRYASL